MARGRKRKVVDKSPLKPHIASHDDGGGATQQFQDRQIAFNHQEVERRIAAIQAIQVAEVHTLLTLLHVFSSYLSKEQLQTPALKFFEENLPNFLVVRNDESKIFELRQIEKKFGGNERVSMVNAVGDLHFSMESDDALDMSQMLSVGDAFQTPGGTNNRLSFGMTPKTTRLPKQGEMLLSVHGSPLGVYKEDPLEAIHESGDGSNAASE